MSRIRLCPSLYGSTEEILRDIESAPAADLFEIRIDLSDAIDLLRIRTSCEKPLLIASHKRSELLAGAESCADYVDIGPARATDPRHIVSVHTIGGNPEDLWQRYGDPDHITKIVVQTEDYSRIAELLQLHSRNPGRVLAFAMSPAGAFSRILSGFHGAPWMYCSMEGRPTAEGQFTYRELVDTYKVHRFENRPVLFGIVGSPVVHSKSPQFHNARFAEAGLPWLYVPFECTDIESLFANAPEFGVSGFSVTHPHKHSAAQLLDHASAEVRQLGACNTVCFRDGELHGINTDVAGIRDLLRDVPLAGSRFVIVGAGSSARAVASVVRPQVGELHILNRTLENAGRLAREYDASSGTLADLGTINYDVLFQTTPVGLREGECPVNPLHLHSRATVIDAIYNPPQTELLKNAAAIGCRTRNGEAWFLAQAEAQFEWWKSML